MNKKIFKLKIKKILKKINKIKKVLLYIITHPQKWIKGLYILITQGYQALEIKYQSANQNTKCNSKRQIWNILFVTIIYFIISIIFFIISFLIKIIVTPFSKKITISKNKKTIDGVSFIIPTWNKKEMVLTCIKLLDLHLSKEQPTIKKEIIVIENGSNDGSAEAIKKLKTKIPVILLEQKTNLGFAKAINLGLKKSKYNYVYLINNDMEVQKGFFDSIIKSANKLLKQKINFFGISSQIFFFDKSKRREESGKTYCIPSNIGFIRIAHYVQDEGLKTFSSTLYPGGGSSLINKHYFQLIGGYDHKSYTPLYCEDLDTGFVAWKLGLPSYFDPNSKVIHHHRSSSVKLIKDPNYFMYKNWLVLILKNYDSAKNIFKHIFVYPILIVLSEDYSKYSIEAIKNIKNIFLSKIKLYKYKTINSDTDIINFAGFETKLK